MGSTGIGLEYTEISDGKDEIRLVDVIPDAWRIDREETSDRLDVYFALYGLGSSSLMSSCS